MKFNFDPTELRKSFLYVRSVKPVSGDYTLKFENGVLNMFSSDRRRYVCSEVKPTNFDAQYNSDDHYLTIDKYGLFDNSLDCASIHAQDKGLLLKVESNDQSRQTLLKKRAENSRRICIPGHPDTSNFQTIKAGVFDEILQGLSCSALIKETKTDDDMKINQVHFYSTPSCGISNARYYMTIVTFDEPKLDLSITSADIPVMRSFCSRAGDSDILVGQENTKIFLIDKNSESRLVTSAVFGKKPEAFNISDQFDTVALVNHDHAHHNVNWANLSLDGTQRVTVLSSDGKLELLNGSNKLAQFPIKFLSGDKIHADFPAKILLNVIHYTQGEEILFKYGHREHKTILEVTSSVTSAIKVRHFVQSMRMR